MITETFLKVMVGCTAVVTLIALVALVVQLQRQQKDNDSK
jgi:hypothetical protein